MPKLTFLRASAIGCASLVAVAHPASADQRYTRGHGGHGGAVLYADASFSGEAIRIDGPAPSLSRLGFNDRASSIDIRSGAWEVCTDADFRGRCEVINTSTARLKTYRLNDNISSLRPVGYGSRHGDDHRRGRGRDNWGAGLILFSDAGQRGKDIEVTYDVQDLGAYRFNDRASSFLVTGGTWLVCEHANYRGRCEVLTRGPGDLKPIRMNDNISSIRRYDGWR